MSLIDYEVLCLRLMQDGYSILWTNQQREITRFKNINPHITRLIHSGEIIRIIDDARSGEFVVGLRHFECTETLEKLQRVYLIKDISAEYTLDQIQKSCESLYRHEIAGKVTLIRYIADNVITTPNAPDLVQYVEKINNYSIDLIELMSQNRKLLLEKLKSCAGIKGLYAFGGIAAWALTVKPKLMQRKVTLSVFPDPPSQMIVIDTVRFLMFLEKLTQLVDATAEFGNIDISIINEDEQKRIIVKSDFSTIKYENQ